ncbi:carbonic anhydrase [Planotetraspora silvatica]|uniref:carbonic anhydrase n=1 Tax=Planotetraspora silvatica TaxID=234614 RepID=A0A8J3UNA8_9ACTN|nr:carbonic anhydrase [Planotetraspora silvatica]GII49089.1 carbonic anhydrase [Planotetraspora silvatica]
MSILEALIRRNRVFAETRFDPRLRMRPSLNTTVITCLDPRVDPAVVLGAEQGEIAVLRNPGGRVTPRTIEQLLILQEVARANQPDIPSERHIVVLQHTQCGLTLIQNRADMLTSYFEVAEENLSAVAVGDPRAAVTRDVAALRAEPCLDGIQVSGLVYDVLTGLVDTVVPPREP